MGDNTKTGLKQQRIYLWDGNSITTHPGHGAERLRALLSPSYLGIVGLHFVQEITDDQSS